MTASLQGFAPVYGQAEGALEDSKPCALLPFVFFLHPKDDAASLSLLTTDFHSNTWQTLRSIQQLDDLRDQVGIGGSWNDFLQYLRDAFTSDNVKLILGGPASSIGGHGATSAKVVTQKCKGMPRVTITLEKVVGPSAEDIMGHIGVELLKAFKQQVHALTAEQRTVSQLKEALLKQKEEARDLQKQVDTMSYNGRKKARNGPSQISMDTFDVQKSGASENVSVPEDTKSKTSSRSAALRNKVHMAHARRAKQRGARLADADDE